MSDEDFGQGFATGVQACIKVIEDHKNNALFAQLPVPDAFSLMVTILATASVHMVPAIAVMPAQGEA